MAPRGSDDEPESISMDIDSDNNPENVAAVQAMPMTPEEIAETVVTENVAAAAVENDSEQKIWTNN